MDILIHWITQIIIFLLLAAIIDLLIPATKMKKYIKLVVGLILIIIFLRPVFFLFTIDIEHALESSFLQLYEEEAKDDSIENLIKMQKTEIQASKDAYILEQMTNQLKDIAKTPLQEQFQVEITTIDFSFASEEMSYEGLEEVIVYLRKEKDGEGVVSIVDEVKINTDNPVIEKTDKQDFEQVKRLLQEVWELSDKDLTLKWGEEHFEG